MTKTHPEGALPAAPKINVKRLAPLRARDGDNCWLCDRPMRFEGIANCGKAATIEHYKARAHGGGNERSNLRLCHPGCNRHLKDRTPEQKEKIRAKLARRKARR